MQEVSFVSKGVGGLILRSLLNMQDSAWRKRIKIGRIVQIAPPNRGSRFFGWLGQYKTMHMIFGPMLNDASPSKAGYIPEFPAGTEIGIIACDSFGQKIIKFIAEKTQNRSIYSENDSILQQAKETVRISNWHLNPLKNKEIVQKTVNFLNIGSFSAPQAQKIKKL